MKMKSLKLITGLLACICATGAWAIRAQSTSKGVTTPEALVADLYRAQKEKRGPFFQTRSRALLYKYFEKDLANLIWNDEVKSKGEVGVIEGDPLYDAQDMEIKHFVINKARHEPGRELVDATFENFGEKKTITFMVVKGAAGWRIHDIVYAEGRTLRSEFKEGN
jgi:Protein of unknown function (DUF3828)